MEKSDPSPKPQGSVSQDDGGLWMKMDSNHGTEHTESLPETCGERTQDETTVNPSAQAVDTSFYRGMDNVDTDDDVLSQLPTPPSPPFMVPLPPAEGSTDGTVNNSKLTFANGAADATKAEANPDGLDWHHSEKQLMVAHNELDELMGSREKTSKESVDTASLSENKESAPSKSQDQDPSSMESVGNLMGICYDPHGGNHQDNTARNIDLTEEPEDIDILSERPENWREVEVESKTYPKQVPQRIEEISEKETYVHKDRKKTKTDGISVLAETKSKLTAEKENCGVKKHFPTRSSLRVKDDDLKSSGPPELCKHKQNSVDEAMNQPHVSEIVTEVMDIGDDEHVDTRSLNYKLAKYDWVRRESGVSETLLPGLPISEGSVETISKAEQGPGSKRIASNVQQGEQLLQRLQLVQLRQDVHVPENPNTSQLTDEKQGVIATEEDYIKARKADLKGINENQFHTIEDVAAKANIMEEENDESQRCETKAWSSLPTMSVKPEHCPIARPELGDSDDDKSEIWGTADWSSIDETSSTQNPLLSNRPRLSVAETFLEKQIHEAAQKKQNLQRAGGVFNLADDFDVIEIPFKTNFLLEPLPTKVGQGEHITWQFSEQKMQNEISQELQRELVMVNQGKIPGTYSKGEVRQLKETKLLFEAFQQENMEGPTSHQKLPASLLKGHVCPSVLERTRSLEMFSLKSLALSRTHSFWMNEFPQMKKGSEEFRAKSPNGGSRDKTRSSPYQKQDKHARQYRSMDLISTDDLTMESRSAATEGNLSDESPTLKHNPFFKLRRALVLQPEVEKDIREAKEREEELRKQRSTLYGENKWKSKDKDMSRFTPALSTDGTGQSRGKLERFWPPPKKDQKPEQTQEAKVRRTGGQKAALWQRWESGQINGQPSQEKN
ncbi:uncharacterized protein [Labrus bergylta]|uniref:uncharacterized protein isoform X2 n=1 Tax=Labrus bergylta TaxID=56723 RepID=UPI0033134281